MPTFRYTAVDDSGRRVEGTAGAENEDALAVSLRDQGQHLVRATIAAAKSDLAQIRIFERVNRHDLIFFTSQLATVVATGLTLVEGLTEIEFQSRKAPLKKVAAAIRRDIEAGTSLSTAMSRHPKVFNELYLNIVRAGEATGKLDRTLSDLVLQLEWQDGLNSRIREVATYPIIVIVMMIGLGVVLVGFTIPRFMQVYERLGTQIVLPLPTRVVMGVASVIRTYWSVLLTAMVAGFIGFRMYVQTPAGGIAYHRWLLRVPIVGELFRKVALSRFAHYFGTLHEAGLEVAPSLTLVERVIGNAFIAQQFHRAVDRVMVGDSLSRALHRVGEFPPVVIQMISIGERSGQMSKALADVRHYFDQEIDRSIKRSLTLFGPIMLIVLASAFVVMALAFYLPMFQMLRGIK